MTRTGSGLRVLPTPDSQPPFEGGEGSSDRGRHRPAPRSPGVQGTLALAFELPSGVPTPPHRPAGLRLVESRPDVDAEESAAGTLAEVRPWAGTFVQALVEILAGARPATQLLRWTSPEVYDTVKRRAAVPGGWTADPGAPRRARVQSVRLCQPRHGVTEVCAVVRGRDRARAIALRLERAERQWRCTELDLG